MGLIDFSKAQAAGEAIEQDALKNVVTQVLPALQATMEAILKGIEDNAAAQRVAVFQELAQFRDDTLAKVDAMLDEKITRLGTLKVSAGLSVDGPESKA
jgi:DNA-binding GntR family transcriptional regulator